jgi:hypothetical protein
MLFKNEVKCCPFSDLKGNGKFTSSVLKLSFPINIPADSCAIVENL